MIDLHLHLDGSVYPDTLIKIAKKEGIDLPTYDEKELLKYLQCPIECQSLIEYLTKFDLPGLAMQTKNGLETITFDLIKHLNAQNILYAEIRFAPQLHLKKGLSQIEVVEAVLNGMNKASKVYDTKVQFILCCMRGKNNHDLNLETVRVAQKFLNQGVCALDLAGAESLYKTTEFEEEFSLAKKLQIPFTIHAGESDLIESIKAAIDFGACRIGHGIRAIDDEEFMEFLAKNKIGIEMCPTSNLQTKAVRSLKEYPLRTFLKHHILATINTDNMTVSNTTIKKEFELLKTEYNLSLKEEIQLLKNAVQIAFLDDTEKKELLKRMGL